MATSHSESWGTNPFQPPGAGAQSGLTPSESRGQLTTPRAIEMLKQTRPWVRFLSVLGFMGTFALAVSGFLRGVGGMAGPVGGMPGLAILGIYVTLSLLYFFPSLFLWRYADCISRLQVTEAAADLESALEAQRSFWRFVGIALGLWLGLLLLLGMLAPFMMMNQA